MPLFSPSSAWAILSSMTDPKLPWYQFSLRFLLLLPIFVAVLGWIGVRRGWSISAVVAVGGVAGGLVARKWSGLVLGVFSGIGYASLAVVVCGFFCFAFGMLPPSDTFWQWTIAAAIVGALIGGIFGGLTARHRSGR